MAPNNPVASGGNPLQSRRDNSHLPEATASLPTRVITSWHGQHHGPF